MVYLLALILPITFLYSPKIEKSGAVFFAKPMTITQERKSPAYEVFKQAQKVSQSNSAENKFEISNPDFLICLPQKGLFSRTFF